MFKSYSFVFFVLYLMKKCKNVTKMGLINLLKKIYKKKDLIYFYLKSLSFKADASSRFI